ncbi:MAG TPA: DUF3037 domain-containing protein [Aldersonia sp.]
MEYQYWLVRYVPDTVRGEYVNIGLVVGGRHTDWAFRRVERLTRAKALGGATEGAVDWLNNFERKLAGVADFKLFPTDEVDVRPSVGWVEALRRRLSNTVQLSEARVARGDSAEHLADLLFAALVVDPPRRVTNSTVSRLRTNYSQAFEQSAARMKLTLRENVAFRIGRQTTPVDFAVSRANEVVQLTQVLSFQRRDARELQQRILASTLGVERLRRGGGRLVSPRTEEPLADLTSQVPVRILYAPPKTAQQQETFQVALEAWADAGIQGCPEGDESKLVHELAAAS